jgi:Cd2+/Zn2+-exporting ATPase
MDNLYSLDQKKTKIEIWSEKVKRHGEMIAAVGSGLLVLIAFLLESRSITVSTTLFLCAYLIGGFVKAREGLITLFKEKEIDVNLLMLLAAIGAAAIGYWLEGAMLIFIFAMSGALESYTMAKSERDLSQLMSMQPETANVLDGEGREQTIRIENLRVGDVIVVRPGEKIAADGVVLEGMTTVNEAMITGESVPAEKEKNSEVYAGTINGAGSLIVKVSRAGKESVFSRIIQHIEKAKNEVPQSQTKIERFERIYAKAVLGITVVLMFLPHYLLDWSWSETVYRSMVFLVVASPCALVASIMPAILSAISNGSRNGILFKSGLQLENLSRIKLIAFDKTGTLTKGELAVTDIIPLANLEKEELLRATASIESLSEHPIAKAIVRHAKEKDLNLTRPTRLEAITGWGVKAEYQGESWRIGKPKMFEAVDPRVEEIAVQVEQEGKTVIFVEKAGELVGLFALRDTVRPEAKELIKSLKKMEIQVAMLTGDQKVTAQVIGKELGIDRVYSELLPEEKVKMIQKLREENGQVAMVGDGVNDAPALVTANIGIAMGGAGSDVALDTADLVLMKDDLSKLPQAIRLGKRVQRIIKQNMVFALSIIALLVVTNFLQFMTLPLGVVGHEGSTLLVILNGLRMLR